MKKQKDKKIVEEKKLIKENSENSKNSNHEKYEEENSEQEEGLEEKIENIEDVIDDVQFQEFFNPFVKSSTPVLERIAGGLPQPVFVDTGSQNMFDDEKEKKVNYNPNQVSDYVTGEDKLLKKQDYEFMQSSMNDSQTIRKDLTDKGQKFLVDNSQDLRTHNSSLETKYVGAERISREESRLPFEDVEKKYKRIR